MYSERYLCERKNYVSFRGVLVKTNDFQDSWLPRKVAGLTSKREPAELPSPVWRTLSVTRKKVDEDLRVGLERERV